MSGPISVRAQKALLTRYRNNLNAIIAQHDDDLSLRDDALTAEVLQRIHALTLELRATSKLVRDQMATFVRTIDSLDVSLDIDQENQLLDYIEKTHEVIDRAEMLAIKLELKRANARDGVRADPPLVTTQPRDLGLPETLSPKLPPIPIPNFDGRIWEYGNFWTLFQANVHSLPTLTKLQKFNYLLRALRGEARDLVRRYPVTEDNYEHALNLLNRKYGSSAQLISALQSRLEGTKAEKHSTSAQRKLLEFIIPLVTQLQSLGVCLDGSYNTQKIVSKFAPRIQRKVLEHLIEHNIEEGQWKMKDIIEILDARIGTEERINGLVTQERGRTSNDTQQKQVTTQDTTHRHSTCIFCNSSEHRAASCIKYPTLAARRSFLQENHMCLNCGREGHFVRDCTRDGCKSCQGKKHHHTLCPLRVGSSHTPKSPQTSSTPAGPSPEMKRANTQQSVRRTKPSGTSRAMQAHPLQMCTENQPPSQNFAHDDRMQDPPAVLSNTQMSPKGNDNVLLLTGIARTWNTNAETWQDVEILFDTGADQSFINQGLAEQLGLKLTDVREFTIYTFGSTTPTVTTCGITSMALWDKQGDRHDVRLYTVPVLTSHGKVTRFSSEDLDFLVRNNVQLSKTSYDDRSKPQILLGCDQLWDLLETSAPRYTLPSGLQLIPSKLGYLLTGSQRTTKNSPMDRLDDPLSAPPTMATMIQCLTSEEEDLQRWDKYWTMDSAGICEFMGTKDAEKLEINTQVLKFFNDTIEKRSDGYYVRLPFKNDHPPLPTNKAIALKRLQSSLITLKYNPKLLEDYDNIFKMQLEENIIEEVPQQQLSQGRAIHYIPHQAVITPQKQTTKLRIVFDASSHFKEYPSLNDILHQGPLILPQLYALLLRFRMSRFIVTSDIEKAFLQIRLNEADRNVTRFFWVRDFNKDPTEDNLVTYRFTRVTFGLNVSPFLLAATIHYHLRNEVEDKMLEQEIRENLYVDNLILQAETRQDGIRKSIQSRKIFADMNMNLREFLSNDKEINKELPEIARATTNIQKVLGINWNSEMDTLTIQCDLTPCEKPTKRTIARQYARLRNAIPRLPSPVDTYEKIVSTCQRLNITTRSVTTLYDRIKSLRLRNDGWRQRLAELQILEVSREKTVIEFALLRTELRTLFAVPPLLVATDTISREGWHSMMTIPRWDEYNRPLLMEQDLIEKVITDQMKLLEEYDLNLSELRQNLQNERQHEQQHFQSCVLAALDQIHTTIEQRIIQPDAIRTAIQDAIAAHWRADDSSVNSAQNGRGVPPLVPGERDHMSHMNADGSEMIQEEEHSLRFAEDDDDRNVEDELEIIRDNIEFIEGLDGWDNFEPMDDAEDLRIAAERSAKRHRIEEEIRQTEQGIADLEEIVYTLDLEQVCEPRNFERGTIKGSDERTMRCAYCGRIGDHYSDSCVVFQNSADRRRILREENRCNTCLNFNSTHHKCRRACSPCYHCKTRGHHSSICDLPERSEEIRSRIRNALEARKLAKEKIKDLREELKQLQ